MANAYIFYGKPGSGKGTQAQLLCDHLKSQAKPVLNLEQGSNFRALAKQGGYVPDIVEGTINSGQLMPVFMPIYLWTKPLVEEFNGTQDIVFDGVARVPQEAEILATALDYLKFEKVFVFHVHIADDTAAERMISRATLAGSSARADDTDPQAAQKRLDLYKNQVMPVIEYFRNHQTIKLVEVNGEEDVAGVFEQIKEVIK